MTDTKDAQQHYEPSLDEALKAGANNTQSKLIERNDLVASDQDTNAEAVKSATPTPKRNK